MSPSKKTSSVAALSAAALATALAAQSAAQSEPAPTTLKCSSADIRFSGGTVDGALTDNIGEYRWRYRGVDSGEYRDRGVKDLQVRFRYTGSARSVREVRVPESQARISQRRLGDVTTGEQRYRDLTSGEVRYRGINSGDYRYRSTSGTVRVAGDVQISCSPPVAPAP